MFTTQGGPIGFGKGESWLSERLYRLCLAAAFGINLFPCLFHFGMEQADLTSVFTADVSVCAEKFGVSPQQWSPWESGKSTPDELRLEQIAVFFDVTVEWLRKDHRDEEPMLDTVAAYTHSMQTSQSTQSASNNPDFIYDIMNRLMELHQRCANHIRSECGNRQKTNAWTASNRLPSTGETSKNTDPVASELP